MALLHSYATVEQLRIHMSDDRDVADEAMLERALNSASRQIDAICGRRFWADETATVHRYKPPEPDIAWVHDIASTTGLIVATDDDDDGTFETTWTVGTDFELEPDDADTDGGAYAWWRIVPVGAKLFPTWTRRKSLRVTALHGWSAVPPDIELATLMRAYALYKRKSSPTGIQGFEGFGMRTAKSDPDIAALIAPFKKIQVAAV